MDSSVYRPMRASFEELRICSQEEKNIASQLDALREMAAHPDTTGAQLGGAVTWCRRIGATVPEIVAASCLSRDEVIDILV